MLAQCSFVQHLANITPMINQYFFSCKKGNDLKELKDKEGDGTWVEERQSAEVARKEKGNKSDLIDL